MSQKCMGAPGVASTESAKHRELCRASHPSIVRTSTSIRHAEFQERRRYSQCDERSGWRQWHSIAGAWPDCPSRELTWNERGSMRRACPSCGHQAPRAQFRVVRDVRRDGGL